MTIFGIGMIALGALFVAFAWRRHRAKVAECEAAARSWQSVEGTIREVSIRERIDRDSEGDESVTYVPQVAYGYRVAAREYEGSRAWLARDAFSNKREADAWASARPAGSTAKVWYDPADPAQCALEIDRPSIVTFLVFALVGLIFAGVGAIFLLF
jgi:hypothetical protein